MFLGICLKIAPKMICEGIFGVGVWIQDIAKYMAGLRQVRKSEGWFLTEDLWIKTDNEYALAMLRDKMLCIDHLVENSIT